MASTAAIHRSLPLSLSNNQQHSTGHGYSGLTLKDHDHFGHHGGPLWSNVAATESQFQNSASMGHEQSCNTPWQHCGAVENNMDQAPVHNDDLETDFVFDPKKMYPSEIVHDLEIDSEVQINGDDLEEDGETEVKMYREYPELWPQENGCAFRIKATDMGRRQKTVKSPVNKIARTLNDAISTEYNHDHLHGGRCLIISNSEFQDKRDRPKRTGSLRDAKTLRKQFETLGFHGIKRSEGSEEMIHENLSLEKLHQILSEATDPSLNDYSDFDCFVCVILSYGVEGAVVCPGEMDDVFVDIKSILEHFTPQQCPSLAMKPKLFFIQGCTPYEINETQASCTAPEKVYPKVVGSLPSMADCLVQYSGVDGCLGWARNRRRGLSFYVQALCRSLKEFCILKLAKGRRSQEVTSLVLSINRAFVDILEDDDFTIDEFYCVPTTTSTLTKRMYFYPKKTENDLEVDTG